MQEYLLALSYDLGKWGADGDFGDATELAVKAFQKVSGITVDGKCGPVTVAALQKAIEALDEKKPVGERVVICGGNCYTTGTASGIAKHSVHHFNGKDQLSRRLQGFPWAQSNPSCPVSA